MLELLYEILSRIICLTGILVINAPNAVHAVVYLIYMFFIASLIIVKIHFEYLSWRFVTIYMGAIAVLFRFVVIILNLSGGDNEQKYLDDIGILLVLIIVRQSVIFYMYFYDLKEIHRSTDAWLYVIDSKIIIDNRGEILFTYTQWYVRLIGLILFIAIVIAVTVTQHINLNISNEFSTFYISNFQYIDNRKTILLLKQSAAQQMSRSVILNK